MQINPHIFREFSIRGVADDDLKDEVVTQIGSAIGALFLKRNLHTLVIGRDVRSSSPRISQSLIAGLQRMGMKLTDVGTVPTPVLNFSTDFYQADGGIMITASHNPADYNGLKIRTASTLQGEEMQEILSLAQTELTAVEKLGSVETIDPLPEYLAHLTALAKLGRQDLRIVIDGGNGTNGKLVASLLSSLGFEVIELYCEPDGRFPNRKPDPTAAGATDDLAAAVQAEQADLGIAFDGDGDRLVAVDDQGRAVFGDQLLMLLARDILRQKRATIVYEILCSQALADDVAEHGGTPVMTPSGYAFIHRAMQQEGAALGGELSGHMFFNEPGFRFDDAILAAIKLLNVLTNSAQPLSALVDDLPTYHSSPEIRLPCPDQAKAAVVSHIRTQYRSRYKVDEIDGARIHFPHGWALVRQSNTQPVISMRFEATGAGHLEQLQLEIQTAVETYIKQIDTA